MTKQIAIISAATLDGGQWQLGSAMPEGISKKPDGSAEWVFRQNTRIERMIRVGSYVEVFARYTDGQKEGIHQMLMPPTISLVFASAPRGEWEDLFNAIPADEERLDEVLDISGNVWRKNGSFPGDSSTTIMTMVSTDDDTIDIYILPQPGSDLDKMGNAIIVTLMPLTVQRTTSNALSLQQWMSIMHEAQEAADDNGDPEDPEDPEEPEELELQPQAIGHAPPRMPTASAVAAGFAPPPAPATMPNGSGATTTTETNS
jgi:hypothetical protein